MHRGTGFFDVPTTPTPLRYGEVNNNEKETRLPADVVAAFEGRTMAITGWESNLEQLDVGTGLWVGAKCTEVYNHHYVITMASSKKRSDGSIPLVQSFGQAEGNEHRNSFHGIAAGNVAMLIDSPATIVGNFHFINTKSPACGNSTDCPNTGCCSTHSPRMYRPIVCIDHSSRMYHPGGAQTQPHHSHTHRLHREAPNILDWTSAHALHAAATIRILPPRRSFRN